MADWAPDFGAIHTWPSSEVSAPPMGEEERRRRLAEEADLYAALIAAVESGRVSPSPDFKLDIDYDVSGKVTAATRQAHAAFLREHPYATPDTDEQLAAVDLVHQRQKDDEIQRDLHTGGGRVAAYRALGFEMVPVSPGMRTLAGAVALIFETLRSDEAPRQMVEIGERITDVLVKGDDTGTLPWMYILRGILACPTSKGEKGVRETIGKLTRTAAGNLPLPFRKPTAQQIKLAAIVLDEHRVTHRGAGPGTVSPWRLAFLFADAFGQWMPAKESHAKRRKKTDRNRTR